VATVQRQMMTDQAHWDQAVAKRVSLVCLMVRTSRNRCGIGSPTASSRNKSLWKVLMTRSEERSAPLIAIAVSLVLVLLLLPARLFAQAQIFEVEPGVPDLDTRTGWVQPTPQQVNTVSDLGASVRWNHYGTPQSLIKYGGYLATGLSADPIAAARSFIGANAALFRLSNVQKLALLADNQMAASPGHAVTFYQTFGNLPATLDGMITVGVVNGRVAYVSSSAVDDTSAAPAPPTLSPTQAWLTAAANSGRSVNASDITGTMTRDGWTVFAVTGFSFPQRSRLVAFPLPGEAVQAAYEVVVLDQNGGSPTAYKYFVAADTGNILYRKSAVSSLAQQTSFSGTYNPSACTTVDPAYNNGPFVVAAGQKSIDVAVSAVLPSNDIAINLIFGATEATGAVVGSSDVATSPEAIHYAPAGGVPPGNYFVQTCQSPTPTAPSTALHLCRLFHYQRHHRWKCSVPAGMGGLSSQPAA
jgi:extracellular elastinolytic metalloproteinase